MAMINVQVRMDEELKKNMETVLKEMGLTVSSAVNMMAVQIVKQQRIPFEITANAVSKTELTPEDIKEIKEGIADWKAGRVLTLRELSEYLKGR